MTIAENVGLALRALRINPLRSSLAILGIVIGVAVVVAMLAIGSGSHARIEQELRSLGTNLLYVLPRSEDAAGTPIRSAGRNALTEGDALGIANEVSAVEIAAPVISDTATAVQANRSWTTTVVGTLPGFLRAREWRLADGRGFTREEAESAAKVAVLGSTVADRLFGNLPALGRIIRMGNVPLTVVGVLAPKGQDAEGWDQDDVAYVPISTAKLRIVGSNRLTNRQAVGLILVKVTDERQMDRAAEEIRRLMRQRHRLREGAPDDFTVRDMESLISKKDETARTLTIQLAAVASVALLVGGIAVMNIMIVAVTERTREIGLRLAVGARRRDIRNQFLVEALMLCLVGGAIGALLGAALAVLFSHIGGWPVVISPAFVVLAFGSAAGVGLFFGLYPAHKASLMEPVDALRHE